MDPKDLIKIPTMNQFYKVRDALNLTDRQRKIFVYKYSRGWRNLDIAEEIKVNQDTVTADMKVIREKLKAYQNDEQKDGE